MLRELICQLELPQHLPIEARVAQKLHGFLCATLGFVTPSHGCKKIVVFRDEPRDRLLILLYIQVRRPTPDPQSSPSAAFGPLSLLRLA